MSAKAIPDGYHSITPFLMVEDVDGLIKFLKEAFNAELQERFVTPDGSVMHAEVKIGNSMIMMGQASDKFGPTKTMLYLYTEDVDQSYQQALKAGASSFMEPKDQYYGDRNAGIFGPMDNIWWIATHKEDLSQEELQKRSAEFYKKAKV